METAYTPPTITALPRIESWTDIHCPACVPLNWPASKLLLKAQGIAAATGATIQIRCPRCKSLIVWEIGTPHLTAIEKGRKNDRRKTAAFE